MEAVAERRRIGHVFFFEELLLAMYSWTYVYSPSDSFLVLDTN